MLTNEVLQAAGKIKSYLDSLGVDVSKIKDEKLMLTAFVHKSYAADYTENIDYNERLEFLGDSILGAIIAKSLFVNFEDSPESKLTLYKIALVREEMLAEVCKEIMLNQIVFLGKGEQRGGGRQKNAITSDVLEAVIGYIYLDLGVEEVEKFVNKYIYTKIDQVKNFNMKSNKTLLQELSQKVYKEIPSYIDFEYEKDGKGNTLVYKAEVSVQGEVKGVGYGPNKKTAQSEAAKDAYEKLIESNNSFNGIQ